MNLAQSSFYRIFHVHICVRNHVLILKRSHNEIPTQFIAYYLEVSDVNLLRVLESISIIFPINKFLICDSWGVKRMKKDDGKTERKNQN